MLSLRAEDALAQLALCVSVLLLLVAAGHALSKGRVYGVLLGALGMYGLLALGTYGDLAAEFSPAQVQLAAYVTFVGSMLLLTSMAFCEQLVARPRFQGRSHWHKSFLEGANAHARWALVAGTISLALFATARQDFALSWAEARATSGLPIVMATFLLLLSFPGIISAALTGRRTHLLGLIVVNAGCFVLSGSRAAALTMLGFAAWIVLMKANTVRKRVRIIAVLAILALVAHVSLRFIRGFGLVDLITAIGDGNFIELAISSPTTDDISGGEAAIPKYLVFAITSAGSDVYGFMTSITRLALLFVPSSLSFIDKPMDVTYRLWAEAYTSGIFDDAQGAALLRESFITGSFGSVHATLFGEYFLAGRWTSLIISSIIAGSLCVAIDRCLVRLSSVNALLVLGPVVIGMLMVARGNSVIGFGYFVYLTVFVVLIEWVGRQVRGLLLLQSKQKLAQI